LWSDRTKEMAAVWRAKANDYGRGASAIVIWRGLAS